MGIAELKARLSEYLARVQDGEEIVVADRGRPVARLVPPVQHDASDESAHLLTLQRRGLIRMGSGAVPDELWQMNRPPDRQSELRSALEAERAEGH